MIEDAADRTVEMFDGPKGTSQMPKRLGSKQDYGTPIAFIEAVIRRFGPIHFDLAASTSNRVVTNYYSEEDDSLSQRWDDTIHSHQLGWLNPPFKHIAPWAKKCAEFASQHTCGARIAFLVPAAVGSNWYAEHVHPHAYVFGLSPRLTFVGETNPYPKDLILCLFGGGFSTGFQPWRWDDGNGK